MNDWSKEYPSYLGRVDLVDLLLHHLHFCNRGGAPPHVVGYSTVSSPAGMTTFLIFSLYDAFSFGKIFSFFLPLRPYQGAQELHNLRRISLPVLFFVDSRFLAPPPPKTVISGQSF